MKLLRFILFALAWVAAALCATWAFGALYFDFPKAGPFAALLFVIALLAIVIFVRGKLLKPAIVFGSAIFCVQTAALMAQIHKGEKPLARVAMIGDFPIGIAKDGTSVVALQWEYAAWTSGAAQFSTNVQKLAAQSGQKQKNCCGSLRTSFITVTRGIGKARHHRAGPAPSASAQMTLIRPGAALGRAVSIVSRR